jgi:hypothetical protein
MGKMNGSLCWAGNDGYVIAFSSNYVLYDYMSERVMSKRP